VTPDAGAGAIHSKRFTEFMSSILGKQAMSIVTRIAKAVAAELNRKDEFSVPFDAVFSVKPGYELSELDTIRVIVVPKTLEIERASRSSSKYTVTVDVGIMQRLGKMTPEEAVETLGDLVDEIANFLSDKQLDDFPEATFTEIDNNPVYVPEYLTQNRTFMSVLSVKYVLCT